VDGYSRNARLNIYTKNEARRTMAFLSGKLPDDAGERDLDSVDSIDIAEQPTEPVEHRRVIDAAIREAREQMRAQARAQHEPRVCPVCLYYREQAGEHVQVGTAQLRLCADHMRALEEADFQTRIVLRDQTRRAFNWYFWPRPADPWEGGSDGSH
jgi:hypothetical protein